MVIWFRGICHICFSPPALSAGPHSHPFILLFLEKLFAPIPKKLSETGKNNVCIIEAMRDCWQAQLVYFYKFWLLLQRMWPFTIFDYIRFCYPPLDVSPGARIVIDWINFLKFNCSAQTILFSRIWVYSTSHIFKKSIHISI